MKPRFGSLVSVSAAALVVFGAEARVTLSWSEGFRLPPQAEDGRANPGVARPYCGEHNGMVLLAGGANFPDAPLAEGGAKRYHATVYGSPAGSNAWSVVGELPAPMGEGVSVATPRGIVCVGGAEGADGGRVTSNAFLMTWDPAARRVGFEPLPAFPYPVKMAAAAARGDRVYVAGGWRGRPAESDVWTLDLAAAGKRAWRPLAPLPVKREQPVAAVQNTSGQRTALFVMGGMASREDGMQTALEDGWFYDLAQGEGGVWRPVAPARVKGGDTVWPLIGAAALATGDQHILVFGGSHRDVWNDQVQKNATLTGAALAAFREAYFRQPSEAFRFNRQVLAYHTVTDRWFEFGEFPFAPRCGAAVVRQSDGTVLVAGGEVGPGVRTPECAAGAFVRTKTLHPVNLAVIAAYFVAMALQGFYFMRRNKNTDDYFRGGGRLPWWAVSFSIYATMFSSITFLSVPALSYATDCRYYVIAVGILAVAPLVARYYLPFFRRLNLTSAYEYLEVRFNLACRLFASGAFTLFMIARTAVVTYLPAIALAAVVDIDVDHAIILVTVVTILYCTVGGIEAVIWNDVVQSVVMIGGMALIAVLLIAGTDGGLAGFVETGRQAGKFRVLDFAFDLKAPVFWVVLVGGIVANLASYTSDQCVVQRYITTKDERGAARSILFNAVLSFLNCGVFFLIGVALFTYYHSNPAALDVTMPKNDSVFPIYIASDMPLGVTGLILAAVAAATISTLSSNLNSSATAVTTDFYARLFKNVDERRKMRCGRLATIVTGVLGGGFALVLANMDVYSMYDQFQRFLGVLTGGLACLFFMGVFMPRVNGTGAMIGLVANYAVCVGLDQCDLPWKPHLLLFGAAGMAVCLAVASAASPLFPGDRKNLKGLCWRERENAER
jgi:cyclically-permuted mutarotase family protein